MPRVFHTSSELRWLCGSGSDGAGAGPSEALEENLALVDLSIEMNCDSAAQARRRCFAIAPEVLAIFEGVLQHAPMMSLPWYFHWKWSATRGSWGLNQSIRAPLHGEKAPATAQDGPRWSPFWSGTRSLTWCSICGWSEKMMVSWKLAAGASDCWGMTSDKRSQQATQGSKETCERRPDCRRFLILC